MVVVLTAAVSSTELLLVWGHNELQNGLLLFLLKVEKYSYNCMICKFFLKKQD